MEQHIQLPMAFFFMIQENLLLGSALPKGVAKPQMEILEIAQIVLGGGLGGEGSAQGLLFQKS